MPFGQDNFDRIVALSQQLAPDMVIHAGDISWDGASHPPDLGYAQAQLGRLHVPLRVIPGNHDVGDEPPGCPGSPLIEGDLLARYCDAFGADYWRVDQGGWTLLGVNGQLFGSGLPRETAHRIAPRT